MVIAVTVGEKCGRAAYEAAQERARAHAPDAFDATPWADLSSERRLNWECIAEATVHEWQRQQQAYAILRRWHQSSPFVRDSGDAPP